MTFEAPRSQSPYSRDAEPVLGWTGWIAFAGVMLVLLGFFEFIGGLTAVLKGHFAEIEEARDSALNLSPTALGWIHLVFGVLMVAAGAALVRGVLWARIFAVVVAGLSAIANLVSVSSSPFFATTVLILNLFVIYAIVVHGSRAELGD